MISPAACCARRFSFFALGLVAFGASVPQSVQTQRDIDSARARSEENARASRARLQQEFARMDRNLEAANAWVSRQQAADSQRMNDGVNEYLRRVHAAEAEARRLAEERRRKNAEEAAKWQQRLTETFRRSRAEQAAAAAARARFVEQMKEKEIADTARAISPEGTMAMRLQLLRDGLYDDNSRLWQRAVAAGLHGGLSARAAFWLAMNQVGERAFDDKGRLTLDAGMLANAQATLKSILAKIPRPEMAQQLTPAGFAGLVRLTPDSFISVGTATSASTATDVVNALKALRTFQQAGQGDIIAPAVSALVTSVAAIYSRPDNDALKYSWKNDRAGRLTLGRTLWQEFDRPEDALRCLGPYSFGDENHAQRELEAACRAAWLLSFVDPAKIPFGHLNNALGDQAWVLETIPPAQRQFSSTEASLLKLQVLLRAHPEYQPALAEEEARWRRQLLAQRGNFSAYYRMVEQAVKRATTQLTLAKFPDAIVAVLRSEADATDNPRAFDAADGLLRIARFRPKWQSNPDGNSRPAPLSTERIRIVSAWLTALRCAAPEQRAPLLKSFEWGYPNLLAVPDTSGFTRLLDRRLFLLDAELNGDLFATAALLGLEELREPDGTLPKDPAPWLARLADYKRDATPEKITARWIGALERAQGSRDPQVLELAMTARLALARLAHRNNLAHEPALAALRAKPDLLLWPGAELAPGFPVDAAHLVARATWEQQIAADAAPLDAARAAVAGLKPAEAAALAFALAQPDQAVLLESPLLLPHDPSLPVMLLRAVEDKLPDASALWPRLLTLSEPHAPATKAEWDKLRTTGMW